MLRVLPDKQALQVVLLVPLVRKAFRDPKVLKD